MFVREGVSYAEYDLYEFDELPEREVLHRWVAEKGLSGFNVTVPYKEAVVAIHAGWKGTVLKIVLQTISEMSCVYGTNPLELKAVIGPGISFDSFQVGEEVVRIFRDNCFPMERIWRWDGSPQYGSMKGGHHIDLKAANRWLLEQAGIPAASILVSEIDTYTDVRFFSARREGQQCGRNINAIRISGCS